MDQALQDHLAALRRFNAWETARRRENPPSLAEALAWLDEAWELADRYGPREPKHAQRERHLEDLLAVRRALERANLRP